MAKTEECVHKKKPAEHDSAGSFVFMNKNKRQRERRNRKRTYGE